MLKYLAHRLLIMIPTLLAISLIVFVIIQLPPGDYLTSYINELQSQGEAVDEAKIAFLRGGMLFLPRPRLRPGSAVR